MNNLVQYVYFLVICFLSLQSFAINAEPYNIGTLKTELVNYQQSGTYEKELAETIAQAREFIIQQLTNEKFKTHKLAVVLDIDETCLTNYKNIFQRGFADNHKAIYQEMLAADAPPIFPTLALYNELLRHGVNVFFVTGRPISLIEATRKNLNKAGFKKWTGLYLRPENYKYASIGIFKAKIRQELIQQGYTILASIGDQHSDIQGCCMEKGFKLPNPFYYLP